MFETTISAICVLLGYGYENRCYSTLMQVVNSQLLQPCYQGLYLEMKCYVSQSQPLLNSTPSIVDLGLWRH